MTDEYQNPPDPVTVPVPEEKETETSTLAAETTEQVPAADVSLENRSSDTILPGEPLPETVAADVPYEENSAADASAEDTPSADAASENTAAETPDEDSSSSAAVLEDTPGEEQSPSVIPGNRDDYFTEEPPKLKYYNESERQDEINKYKKFKKVDGATYRKVNVFLRKRTYITAREWAIARLCADFKTPYGSEMTFIGEHLPELCPFMEEPYSPQAVNQARASFKRKVRKSAATFLYGAMCGFFTPEELDDILFEANEVSKFFLEIEGTSLELDDEIEIEDKISAIMKKLGDSARILLKNRADDAKDSDDEDDDEEVDVVGVEESVSSKDSAAAASGDVSDSPSSDTDQS